MRFSIIEEQILEFLTINCQLWKRMRMNHWITLKKNLVEKFQEEHFITTSKKFGYVYQIMFTIVLRHGIRKIPRIIQLNDFTYQYKKSQILHAVFQNNQAMTKEFVIQDFFCT